MYLFCQEIILPFYSLHFFTVFSPKLFRLESGRDSKQYSVSGLFSVIVFETPMEGKTVGRQLAHIPSGNPSGIGAERRYMGRREISRSFDLALYSGHGFSGSIDRFIDQEKNAARGAAASFWVCRLSFHSALGLTAVSRQPCHSFYG